MSFRTAAKVDGNQTMLVRQIRKLGYSVKIVSQIKKFCDIVVGKNGMNWLFEIKDPAQPESKRCLTKMEKEFHDEWRGQVDVIETIDDFLKIVGG